MGNLFRVDSPLMQTLTDIVDLVLLNILVTILCIPIVTIGPVLSALYDVTARMHRDEGRLYYHFFRAIKTNFKRGLGLGLILLPLGVMLSASLIYYTYLDLPAGSILNVITMMLAILWAMVFTWVFPLQSRFENTVRETLRNALLCSLAYLPRTIFATALNLLPWLLLYFATNVFVKVGYVWVCLWFALTAYVNWKILDKPFKRIMGVEDEPEKEKEEEDAAF